MADIFDLARSINRQRQQSQQGYSSPLEQLPLQVMEVMNTRRKEKRVSLKNDSIILSELIKNASTEEEIQNVSKLANQYGKDAYSDPETKLYGEAIGMQANQKKDAYNQFVASAEWFDKQLSEVPDEKEIDSTDYGLSQINDKTWDGLANEKFGKNVSDLSDVENIEMMATISKGGSDQFRSTRGWGEWSTVQNNSDKQFKDMIENDGFDSIANKYNISSEVSNKIKESFDNDSDRNQALSVVLAESAGKSDAINYNYGDGAVKGRSYFDISQEELMDMTYQDISKRINELEGYTAGMKSAEQFGFKYAKGVNSLTTLQNTFGNYQQKLEDTLKAHRTGGKITDEEAMGILLGDFEGTRKVAEANIKSNLARYTKEYNRLIKLKDKQLTDSSLIDYAVEEEVTTDNIKSYIDKEMDKLDKAMELEYERQYHWTGVGKKGSGSLFRDFTEGSDTKKLSIVRDRNQDGIPDDSQENIPVGIKAPSPEPIVFGEDTSKSFKENKTMSGKELFPAGFFRGSSKKVSQQQNRQYPVGISLKASNVSSRENIKNKAKSIINSTVSRGNRKFMVTDSRVVNGKIELKLANLGIGGARKTLGESGIWESPRYGSHKLKDYNIEATNRANSEMPIAFKKQGIPYYYDPIKDMYIVSSNEVGKGK
jgi:hypothetical protein